MRLSSLYTWPELADTAVLGISWSEMRLSSLYYWPELADTAVLGISWSDTWLSSLYLARADRHSCSWNQLIWHVTVVFVPGLCWQTYWNQLIRDATVVFVPGLSWQTQLLCALVEENVLEHLVLTSPGRYSTHGGNLSNKSRLLRMRTLYQN